MWRFLDGVVVIQVKKDLTGLRFGRLVVVKQAEDYVSPKGLHKARWLCKCDCGNYVTTRTEALKDGRAKSCGCYQKEQVAQYCRDNYTKYNEYDLSGEYGVGYILNGEKFYFDLEDYDKIKGYYWATRKGYLYAKNRTVENCKLKIDQQTIKMHRLVMGCYDDVEAYGSMDVDHRNHNKFDNRKSNLRICTRQENNRNRGVSNHNTSGVIGVSWYESEHKWGAYITIDNKHISLGRYDNFDDAVKARKEAEEKYFGEYAYDVSIGAE